MAGPIQFKANLRLTEAITIIVGSMIGSGILLLPADMAVELPSPSLILVVLVAGAALTVLGALTFAEMAAMFPRAGGQYHFLREGAGRFPAYLFGWTQFWVIQSGIIAGVAVAFARFVDFFAARWWAPLPGRKFNLVGDLDGDPFTMAKDPATGASLDGFDVFGGFAHIDAIAIPGYGQAFVAIGAILVLAGVNWMGARFGGIIQNLSVVAKVTGLTFLVVLVFAVGEAHPDAYVADASSGNWVPGGFGAGEVVAGFGAALALSLFAYDGWPQATYVAAEVRNPKRNLPLALTVGPLITSAVYVALAAAYFYVIPAGEAVQLGIADERIATTAAQEVVGWGAVFISAVALVSVFGTVNGFLLTAPRIFYAFSRDGGMLGRMGELNRNGVPGYAILVTALWASLLVMTGGYAQLVIMVVFGIYAFYIPTAWVHMRMRRTLPDVERPYRTPLYPFIPMAFLLASVFVVGIIYYKFLAQALIATALILLGIPFYFLQRPRMDAADRVNASATR